MGVRLVVANTDFDWFNTLRQIPNLAEVNFWAPSQKAFRVLEPGEFFLFKLKAPINMIAGGGIFAHATTLPCSWAWKTFGTGNGAETEPEMRRSILRYKKSGSTTHGDFTIGCRVLAQPFFLEEPDWIPLPKDWAKNIVTLKSYSTDEPEGRKLWDAVINRLSSQPLEFSDKDAARYGRPATILPRLGQGTFRTKVADSYNRRCAVTAERTLPALEAAHILPYSEGGRHLVRNGILLRRDIHSLFDDGYVTVTRDLRFEVSGRIKEEYENGRHYYDMQGRPISVPANAAHKPDLSFLEWHNENRYLG